jgi:hypothetical protein
MLEQAILALALLAALLVLDVAALRWGVDSRTPLLLKDPRPDL